MLYHILYLFFLLALFGEYTCEGFELLNFDAIVSVF